MYQQIDLAGEVCFRPNFFQTKARINYLIGQYFSVEQLEDRLKDLPAQFANPQPRQWSKINWQDTNSDCVVGIDLAIFLSIIKGALDTEAPIRDYSQTSRQYVEPIHPTMAKFVGGIVSADGKTIELGLWEKEERQHTPALAQIYRQLGGAKITPKFRTAKTYQAWQNPYQDLYQHGLHRVVTEYSAACLYLWLMSHSTGALQQVLGELLQDEINHLTKFWGMGMWLYPNGNEQLIKYLLGQIHTILPVFYKTNQKSQSNLKSTFQRMILILNWQSWSVLSRGELIYTFIWVLKRMWHWSSQLTPEYLHSCCASAEFFGNNNIEYYQPEISIF